MNICPLCGSLVNPPAVHLDEKAQIAVVAGREIKLHRNETYLLAALLAAAPGWAPSEAIIERIWNNSADEPLNPPEIVRGVVHRLRKKLDGTPIEILSAWAGGYRLFIKTTGMQ